ncbi:MAG: TetR/AcrR family transcriptional regulator [Ferruginibacter sp.]|nr:TetR/AcrR family transcriptional regulator [Cytophagales bacterium]
MAGRKKEFEEVEAIQQALNLFWSKGYEATSTEELLGVMKLGKSSFYHSFGSKKDLFIRVLDHLYDSYVRTLQRATEQSANPMEPIKESLRQVAKSPTDPKWGCFFGNTLAEMVNVDNELRDRAARYLRGLEEVYYRAIGQAQAQGRMRNRTDARLLAQYLTNLWNGLNISQRLYAEPELGRILDVALQVVD